EALVSGLLAQSCEVDDGSVGGELHDLSRELRTDVGLCHQNDLLRPNEIQPADRSARLACPRLISQEPPTGNSAVAGPSPLVGEDAVVPLAALCQASEVLFELSTTTLIPFLTR